MALPTIRLSDGREARFIRKPRAGDASKAYRIAGPKGNEIDRNAALLAQIVEIDGQGQLMEDMLRLDLDDFGEINDVLQYGRWDAGAPDASGAQGYAPDASGVQGHAPDAGTGGEEGNFTSG